jgi:hypothetical protein
MLRAEEEREENGREQIRGCLRRSSIVKHRPLEITTQSVDGAVDGEQSCVLSTLSVVVMKPPLASLPLFRVQTPPEFSRPVRPDNNKNNNKDMMYLFYHQNRLPRTVPSCDASSLRPPPSQGRFGARSSSCISSPRSRFFAARFSSTFASSTLRRYSCCSARDCASSTRSFAWCTCASCAAG